MNTDGTKARGTGEALRRILSDEGEAARIEQLLTTGKLSESLLRECLESDLSLRRALEERGIGIPPSSDSTTVIPSETPPPITCLRCGQVVVAAMGADATVLRCPGCEERLAGGQTETRLGKYRLIRTIGKGGMGVVYEAEDEVLHRKVALKVLRDVGDVGSIKRLHREATAAARLSHPNIVAIHDVGTVEEAGRSAEHYIAMDFVPGRSLAEAMPRLALHERIRVLEIVAGAVAHAHERGVIHRDLKPQNVLMEELPTADSTTGLRWRVWLSDFGLAKVQDGEDLSRTGMVVGTVHYMSPEQVRGEIRKTGPATDVWALGVTLYEMVTDRKPFDGGGAMGIYEKILFEEPSRRFRRRSDPDLMTIWTKALEKEPLRRYATAREMGEELGRYLRGEPVRTRPVSAITRLWRRVRRKRLVWALAAAASVALFLAGGTWLVGRQTDRKRREAEERYRRERETALEMMRETSAASLQGALELRRSGIAKGLEHFLAPLKKACERAAERAPDLAEIDYRLGRMYRVLMKNDAALACQERALSKDPRYRPALYERAVLVSGRYRNRLEEVRAEALMKEGLRLRSEGVKEIRPGGETKRLSTDALVAGDARLQLDRRRLESDLQELLHGISEVDSGEVHCIQGLLAWVREEVDSAREHLMRAIQETPNLEEAYESLAAIDLEAKRYEDAVRWWKEGLKVDGGYLLFFEGLGKTLYRWGLELDDPQEKFRAALEVLDEAIGKHPDRRGPWWWRGVVHKAQGDFLALRGEDPTDPYEAALRDCEAATVRDPDWDWPWAQMGGTRVNLGCYREGRGEDPSPLRRKAIEDFDEAIRRNPNRAMTWEWRGNARFGMGIWEADHGGDPSEHFRAALEDYREALTRDPTWKEAWQKRCLALCEWAQYREKKGEDPTPLFEDAILQASEAIQQNPEWYLGWYSRGFARYSLSNFRSNKGGDPSEGYESAIRDFEASIQRNRGFKLSWHFLGGAKNNLGSYKLKSGSDPTKVWEEALDHLEEALRLDRRDKATWWFRGNVHFNFGSYRHSRGEPAAEDFRAALADYEEAIRLDPSIKPQLRPNLEHCWKHLQGH